MTNRNVSENFSKMKFLLQVKGHETYDIDFVVEAVRYGNVKLASIWSKLNFLNAVDTLMPIFSTYFLNETRFLINYKFREIVHIIIYAVLLPFKIFYKEHF